VAEAGTEAIAALKSRRIDVDSPIVIDLKFISSGVLGLSAYFSVAPRLGHIVASLALARVHNIVFLGPRA
jgi:hypothetical protein